MSNLVFDIREARREELPSDQRQVAPELFNLGLKNKVFLSSSDIMEKRCLRTLHHQLNLGSAEPKKVRL